MKKMKRGEMKPILLNTKMVKAILDEQKTVTRRVIKKNVINHCDIDMDGSLIGYQDGYGDWCDIGDICPYQVGDVLYVRETWAKIPGASSKGDFAYKYRASEEGNYWDKVNGFKWHPSIHMPKEAARIFLRVTNVRVERLQDITPEDVACEGLSPYEWIEWCASDELRPEWKEEWIKLWNSTIPRKDLVWYGWDANPWVWAIAFERIEVGEKK